MSKGLIFISVGFALDIAICFFSYYTERHTFGILGSVACIIVITRGLYLEVKTK